MATGGAAEGGALWERRRRCAALWGEGAARPARAARRDFKAANGIRILRRGRVPRGLRLDLPQQVCYEEVRAPRLAVSGRSHGVRCALLCGAAISHHLASGPTKSTSADPKTRQGEPSHADPDVDGADKTSGRILSTKPVSKK